MAAEVIVTWSKPEEVEKFRNWSFNLSALTFTHRNAYINERYQQNDGITFFGAGYIAI